jgi:hypothetical protein
MSPEPTGRPGLLAEADQPASRGTGQQGSDAGVMTRRLQDSVMLSLFVMVMLVAGFVMRHKVIAFGVH